MRYLLTVELALAFGPQGPLDKTRRQLDDVPSEEIEQYATTVCQDFYGNLTTPPPPESVYNEYLTQGMNCQVSRQLYVPSDTREQFPPPNLSRQSLIANQPSNDKFLILI